MLDPFTPAGTVSLAVGAGSVSTPLANPGSNQVRVLSDPASVDIVFIKFGDAGVVATGVDMILKPGSVEIFTIGPTQTHMGVAVLGPSTVYATSGDGQ